MDTWTSLPDLLILIVGGGTQKFAFLTSFKIMLMLLIPRPYILDECLLKLLTYTKPEGLIKCRL